MSAQPARARGLLMEAAKASRSNEHHKELARSLTLLATLDRDAGNLAQAIVLASEARLAAQFVNDWPNQSSAEFVIATVYQEIGDQIEAERMLHQLISAAQLRSDVLREADYLYELGQLRLNQNRHQEAASLFAVAHAAYERESDPNALLSLNMRAYAHMQQNELRLALDVIQRTVEEAEKLSHHDQGAFLHTLAQVHLLMGNLGECESAIVKARVKSCAESVWIQIQFDMIEALLYRERGRVNDAIEQLTRLAKQAEKTAFASIEKEVCAALSETYVKAGRTAEAEACKRALRRLADRQAQIKAQQQRDTRNVQHRVSELVVQWNSMPTA